MHLHINACSVCMTACVMHVCIVCVQMTMQVHMQGGEGGTKKERQTEGNQLRGI